MSLVVAIFISQQAIQATKAIVNIAVGDKHREPGLSPNLFALADLAHAEYLLLSRKEIHRYLRCLQNLSDSVEYGPARLASDCARHAWAWDRSKF